jgi:hypothetical protein
MRMPPRPLRPGDIVTTYSEHLGEWTAAQITDLQVKWQQAGVLELDWSGPEPATVADLGDPTPLRLTYHSHRGGLSHSYCDWLLPRGYRVIGNAPLLHDARTDSIAKVWRVGAQLSAQRRWDAGDRTPDPRVVTCTGMDIALDVHAEVFDLRVRRIDSLDCDRLVACYPNLVNLSVDGNLGTLGGAASLKRLTGLKSLFIGDLFGMSTAECVLPGDAPAMERLALENIPVDYAHAMRAGWRQEIRNGTSVDIRGARTPEWLAENRSNPLRDWDMRLHIGTSRYKKAVARYRATRQVLLAAFADGTATPDRLAEIGREYGGAFNKLGARRPFIETEEREDLYRALRAILDEAQAAAGRDMSAEWDVIAAAVDSVSNW